jgi:hypothetical protein
MPTLKSAVTAERTDQDLKGYADGRDGYAGIAAWFAFYNTEEVATAENPPKETGLGCPTGGATGATSASLG